MQQLVQNLQITYLYCSISIICMYRVALLRCNREEGRHSTAPVYLCISTAVLSAARRTSYSRTSYYSMYYICTNSTYMYSTQKLCFRYELLVLEYVRCIQALYAICICICTNTHTHVVVCVYIYPLNIHRKVGSRCLESLEASTINPPLIIEGLSLCVPIACAACARIVQRARAGFA